MRYFCGDVKSVAAFMQQGRGPRSCWSNAQVLLHFENGVVGNLTGSYDAGGSYGLERCEVVGSKGRFVLEDACEHLYFYPRNSIEVERYELPRRHALASARPSRAASAPGSTRSRRRRQSDKIDGSGEDGLKVQRIIEAAIKSGKPTPSWT